jgi:phosphohistidine phosphatase
MALYLVQHGLSMPKETDPEQGLTDTGRIEAQRVAIKVRELGIGVTRIIHSGRKRARQTAETFAALLTPGREPVRETGLDPLDDAVAFAAGLMPDEDLMVVGHLPFLDRLASCLITGAQEKTVVKFKNAGLVCMDYLKDSRSWVILWYITPETA